MQIEIILVRKVEVVSFNGKPLSLLGVGQGNPNHPQIVKAIVDALGSS